MAHKTIFRAFAALMTAALTASLFTGCAGKLDRGVKNGAVAVSLDHSYSSEEVKVDGIESLGGFIDTGSAILMATYHEGKETIYRYHEDTGAVDQLDLHYFSTLGKDDEGNISSWFQTPEGGVGFLFNGYHMEELDDGDFDYKDLGFTVETYDKDLNFIDSRSIPPSDDGTGFGNIISIPDGRFLGDTWDQNSGQQTLTIFDADLKVVDTINSDAQYFQHLGTLADGRIYCTYEDSDWNTSYGLIDLETKTIQPLTIEGLPQWTNTIVTGKDGKYDLYMTDSTSVYGVSLSEGKCEEVVNWLNSDFLGDTVNSFAQLSDGRFLIATNETEYAGKEGGGSGDVHLWALSPRDPKEFENVKMISMAALYPDNTVMNAVNRFNRSNSEYRIAVADYSKDASEENDPIERLQNDLTSGIVADLICVNGLPFESLANKGIFADLTPYYDKLDKDKYFSNFFDALAYGDKHYRFAFSFSVSALEGKTSLIGETGPRTVAEFNELIAQRPSGCEAFEEMTKDSAMYLLISSNMQSFIDVNTGECHFDTPEFIALLEHCNSYDAEYTDRSDMSDSEWEKYWAEEEFKYINDKVLLYSVYFNSLRDDYMDRMTRFDDEPVSLIGISAAGSGGNGGMFQPSGAMAISAKTEYMDQCWAFFESMLSDDYQTSLSWGFPVSRTAFDKLVEEAKEPQSYPDESGKMVPIDTTIWRGGEEIKIPEMPQSFADEIKSYIEGITVTSYYDEKVYNIIEEECGKFFSGDQSAQQAASMIQSRASLYLSEQR